MSEISLALLAGIPGDPRSTGDAYAWLDEAACRNIPIKEVNKIFFSNSPGKARAICAECPVVAQCLKAGETSPYGVFGGKTPRERGFTH